MIRKVVVVMLMLGAIATGALWTLSYRLNEPRHRRALTLQQEYAAHDMSIDVYPRDFSGLWWTLKLGAESTLTLHAQAGALKVTYTRRYPWSQAGALGQQNPPVARRFVRIPGWYYWQYPQLDDWEAKFYEAIDAGDRALARKTASERPAIARWCTFRGVECSAWLLLVLLSAYPVIAFIRGPLRRWRRRRKGLCLKCAYDLTGNESGVCPECGSMT